MYKKVYMSITFNVMGTIRMILDYTTHALFLFAVRNIAIRRPTPIFHINLVASEIRSTLMFYQNPDMHTRFKDGLTLYLSTFAP